MRILFFLFFLLASMQLSAQEEEILLMNGKRFMGSAIDTAGYKIIFDKYKGLNRKKTKSYYRDEVFSISYLNIEEKVFFYPNPYFFDEYNIENMRYVVYGRRDAREQYKTKWVMPVGFVIGAASALLMDGSVFVLLVPVVYTGIVQIPLVKIQKESIASPDFVGNGFYAEGYDKSARIKRTKHALLSSATGLLAGLLVNELIK